MSPVLEIAGLWVLFTATHAGLSAVHVRPYLVKAMGERAYLVLYSLLALVLFVPLVRIYFMHRNVAPPLWELPGRPLLAWVVNAGMAVAFVMLVAALARPSPASLARPSGFSVGGIYRITRHPLVMSMVLFGALHLLAGGAASDLVFFGGFIGFGLIAAWHQDRRKRASAGEDLRAFFDETPFLPFTGRETLRGARELSPWVVGLGVAAAIVVRWLHGPGLS